MNDSNQFYSVTSKLEIARLLHLAQTRNALVLMRIPGRPVTSLTTVLHADGHAAPASAREAWRAMRFE